MAGRVTISGVMISSTSSQRGRETRRPSAGSGSRRKGGVPDFLTGFIPLAAQASQTGSGATLATIERSSVS